MSHEVAIDIPSLIRRESQYGSQHQRSNYFINRYHLPEHYYPSYLRHPNQPFSSQSPSSTSSSPYSSPSSSSLSSYDQEDHEEHESIRQQQTDLHLQSISLDDEGAESIVNESSSPISVDGEFDVRIDIIQPTLKMTSISSARAPTTAAFSSSPFVPLTHLVAGVATSGATAPPISDDEIERETYQQQPQQQPQQQEEPCVCVICYEAFEEPVELELNRGRNYTMEELEEIEGKEKISDFCQTCKYNVHHRCIDEYRLSKMTDIIRNGYQRGYIQSPNIAGTFEMKCLMCAKKVEKIHISIDGEINIVKTQPGANDQNQNQQQEAQQQEVQQQHIEEIMRNRMQRRLRRRHRLEFFRKKLCSICMMFLVTVTLLVFIFRVI